MANILLSLPVVLEYRGPFLEAFDAELRKRGHQFVLLHGDRDPRVKFEGNRSGFVRGRLRPTRELPMTGGRAAWIKISPEIRLADIVIVPEMVGWLPTYYALLTRKNGGHLVACWGHGPSLDDHSHNGLTRATRTRLAAHFDWWFAYSDASARRLLAAGVGSERITTIYNSIDVRGLRSRIVVLKQRRSELRRKYDVSAPVAIYVGALRETKRLDVLVECAKKLAEEVEGFLLLVLGDGPLRPFIEEASNNNHWLHYVGPVFGEQKAPWLVMSDFMLQPAAVGLVAVDALAAGLPIVMADASSHGPEAAYIRHGVEGLRVHSLSPEALASASLELIEDPERRIVYGDNAWRRGGEFSVENMAEHFADGIERALGAR